MKLKRIFEHQVEDFDGSVGSVCKRCITPSVVIGLFGIK